MEKILENLKKVLVLSIDLDDTLVIRKKGDNYVNEETRNIINALHAHQDIHLVPNTGRELVGFASFQKQVIDVQDGILGSGAILLCNGKKFYNQQTSILPELVTLFIQAVKQGIIPFVDFSHAEGRLIVATADVQENLADLLFSQTPAAWFDAEMPPVISPDSFQSESYQIFRIEFPVNKKHEMLFGELSKKSEGALAEFANVFGAESVVGYTLKKKAYFNESYKKDFVFARFEKNLEAMNKGIGIKLWMEHMGIDPQNASIIHIGDQDSGIVNDAIIKQELPGARLIMVGNKCSRDNPAVDFYACDGETEDEVRMVLEKILKVYSFI